LHQKDSSAPASISPSKSFTPNIISNPPSILASSTSDSKPNGIDYQEDGESVSKLSDTQSRISSIEQDIKHLRSSLQQTLAQLQLQSQQQASQQSLHEATLTEILTLLCQFKVSISRTETPLDPSARDNLPEQAYPSGNSKGAAGTG
jgi:hypothetical protein